MAKYIRFAFIQRGLYADVDYTQAALLCSDKSVADRIDSGYPLSEYFEECEFSAFYHDIEAVLTCLTWLNFEYYAANIADHVIWIGGTPIPDVTLDEWQDVADMRRLEFVECDHGG